MAPKAKQQAASKAEAKAKPQAEPKPKSEQPAPKAKAEPKAKAAVEPPAAKSAGAAPPKAKAKADAQGPAAGKSSGPAAQPKQQVSKAASPDSAAPKSKAKAASPDSVAPKSKAKGKAKSEPKAPPPPPEPVVVEEPEKDGADGQGKKKKTNHRGGRNKNKEEFDKPVEEKPIVKPAPTGPSAADKAAALAEKDADLRSLRERFSNVRFSGNSNMDGLRSAKTALEELLSEIDKTMTAKKGPRLPRHVCSTTLEQSLRELEQSGADAGMKEATIKQIKDAEAAELWDALKTRLTDLKVRCEQRLKDATKEITVLNVSKGNSNAANVSGGDIEAQKVREQALLRRLADLHGSPFEDLKGSKPETKCIELDPEITKYLFTPPYRFSSRFENLHKVRIEQQRGGKGQGKASNREINVTGLRVPEVDACVETLRALDFSGMKPLSLDNGIVVTRQFTQSLEKEFKVIIFKLDSKLEIFGKKSVVESVIKKIEEDASFSQTTEVSAALVKVIYGPQELLKKWREASSADIKMNQPPRNDSKASQPAKITISGKSRAETEEAMAKVEEFKKSTFVEFLDVDGGVLGKVFDKAKDSSPLAKMFKDITHASDCVVVRHETKDGINLVGSKKDLTSLKEKLKELLQKASYEPQKIELDTYQVSVFTKGVLDQIRQDCKLLEIYISWDKDDSGWDIGNLVLLGDAEAIKKSRSAVQEVLDSQTTENVTISERAYQEVSSNKFAQCKDWGRETSAQLWSSENLVVTICGTEDAVKEAKSMVLDFAEKVDTEITKTKPVPPDEVGRVIGKGGAIINRIKKDSGAKIDCDKDGVVTITGQPDQVEKAEQMIDERLGKGPAAPAPEPKPKAKAEAPAPAKPAPKAAGKAKVAPVKEEFKGNMTEDFPVLGGMSEPKKPAPKRAWGKSAQEEETAPAKEESPEEAYPCLQGGDKKADAKNEEGDDKADPADEENGA